MGDYMVVVTSNKTATCQVANCYVHSTAVSMVANCTTCLSVFVYAANCSLSTNASYELGVGYIPLN